MINRAGPDMVPARFSQVRVCFLRPTTHHNTKRKSPIAPAKVASLSCRNYVHLLFSTMKLLSASLLVVIASSFFDAASAACERGDRRCQRFSGQCSRAVQLTLEEPANPEAPLKVLHYGKYCGGANRCTGANLGRNDNSPPACGDGIDEGCKKHDKCLDLKGPGPVPAPERCPCEVDLLIDMQTAFAAMPEPTGLCDEEFYESFISLLGHESFLIAAPTCASLFCPVVVSDGQSDCDPDHPDFGYGDDNVDPLPIYEDKFDQAQNYCVGILQGFNGRGINLCAGR